MNRSDNTRAAESIWLGTNSPESHDSHDSGECPDCGGETDNFEHNCDPDCSARCRRHIVALNCGWCDDCSACGGYFQAEDFDEYGGHIGCPKLEVKP